MAELKVTEYDQTPAGQFKALVEKDKYPGAIHCQTVHKKRGVLLTQCDNPLGILLPTTQDMRDIAELLLKTADALDKKQSQ